MSGIAGIFFRDAREVERPHLERLLRPMERRGPHGSGEWREGSIGFVHTALWSTPESLEEHLPLTDARGELAITADARLDNREEVLAALGIDRPRAEKLGDGELILRAYESWGESCAKRLVGDFAFAIWDGRRRLLFCARDHFGVKPLYYYLSSPVFLFASEIKALLRVPELPVLIHEPRIADYLFGELEGIDKTVTFYQDVFRLPPAHAMTISPDTASLRRFWSLDPHREIHESSDEDYASRFREVFTEAVRCRMRSPSPVSFMLSGGLDSSAVVGVARALTSTNGGGSVKTLSAVCDDLDYESPYIQTVVSEGGLEPHFVRPDRLEPFLPDVEYILENTDDLFDNDLLGIVSLIYAAGRGKNCHVMLDGVDGDLVASQNVECLAYLLRGGRWLTAWEEARGLARFYRYYEFSGPGLLWKHGVKPLVPAFARNIARSVRTDDRFSMRLKDSMIDPDFARRVDVEDRLRTLRQNEPSLGNTLCGSVREDHCRRLESSYIPVALERYERVAAAHSIEPRHPFFDRRLVELCLALPWNQKLRAGWTKSVLRRSLVGIVPESVRFRTAEPDLSPQFFSVLVDLERDFLQEAVRDNMQEIAGYLDVGLVRKACRRYASLRGYEDGETLWAAASLGLWLRRARRLGPDV